jgi:hypothetical protein
VTRVYVCIRLLGQRPSQDSVNQPLPPYTHKPHKHSFISYPRTETERFKPEQDLGGLIDEQRTHPSWGAYAAALLDGDAQHPQGRFVFPRAGQKDDQVGGGVCVYVCVWDWVWCALPPSITH